MFQSDEITLLRSPTSIIIPSTAPTSGSISAAISVLPNELLAEVFLAGQEDHFLSPWSQKIPFEILVSRVSPHWRILAHDTPRLWTSVIIDTRVKHHLENAAKYIQRSGAVSLDVFVRVLSHRRQLLLTTLAICRLLSAEVERLQTLSVESLSDEAGFTCLQVFFGNMPKSAPHLQMLDIRLSGQKFFNLPMNQSVFPDGLPSLKSLHFVSVSPHNLLLPQCPITSLQIHQCIYYDSSLRGASHFFSAITQLILSESFPSPAWESEQFMFPSLKVLYMRQLDDYDKILSRIVAPELDTLYLEAVTEDEMTEIIGVSYSTESNSSKFPRLRHFLLRLNGGRTLPYGLWHDMMDAFQQCVAYLVADARNAIVAQHRSRITRRCDIGCLEPGQHGISRSETAAVANTFFRWREFLALCRSRRGSCGKSAYLASC
ncbi:hypothetical protein FIBSPDRAFT_305169 [Athelia psychrophila]|uniref:Uncharacterized protein n=1 Tax=Athelia psychrophila TaxID=1759441 RepID=A0A167WZM3_9AGAM|nr:hypothetical protein FIBSPDRAFT_305169 [Fibularhizoctonia sp. CBS 109695]